MSTLLSNSSKISPLFLMLALIAGFSNSVLAQEPQAFSVNSSPYGVPFKEWTEKWWQWYLSIPKSENHNFVVPEEGAAIEAEPVNCVELNNKYRNDSDSPVFFVPYVLEEKPRLRAEVTDATCTVPEGKAVLIGIDNGIMDYGDPDVNPKTPASVTEAVKETNTYPVVFGIRLNGEPIELTSQDRHRITTDLFNITLPKEDIWDYPDEGSDTYPAVADGWYLMLKPLPAGDYELTYTTGYNQPNPAPYEQQVAYHFLVRPESSAQESR